MSPITAVMLVFSVLAAIDRILGNRFGLGKEFERGFMLLGTMALSMIGMIVISPVIADMLEPVFSFVYDNFGLDPSIIPSSLFANDMGGAPLSTEVAKDARIGGFSALIVSSMMGCTVSFTIPFSLGMVDEAHRRELLFGMLCGIITIPIGCFVGGLVLRLPILSLLYNLLPLVIFSLIIVSGLYFKPELCVKIFGIFGKIINIIITVGLSLAVINFLIGKKVIPAIDTLEYGAKICLNASAVMTGAFPLIYVISKLLTKPLKALGNKLSINETSSVCLISTLATSMTTFSLMEKMDKKGTVLNAAFAVSAAFTFAGHLAFTMAYDPSHIAAMIAGKLTAGITAFIIALVFYKKKYENTVGSSEDTLA